MRLAEYFEAGKGVSLSAAWLEGIEPSMHSESPAKTKDIEFLASIGLFTDLSEGEIEEIMGDIPERTAGKGTVLYPAEDGPAELYLLGAGKIELYRRSPGGKKLTLGIVSKGAFFGEMSLIGEHQVGTGAVVIGRKRIEIVDRPQLQRIVSQRTGPER